MMLVLGDERRMRQKAELAQPIVERDDDDALSGQACAVVKGIRAVVGDEAAAMDEHHDGGPSTVTRRSRPDIQGQTVLVGREKRTVRSQLRTGRAERRRVAR